MAGEKRSPIVIAPLVEHRPKCAHQGCNNVARAIVRYPDSTVFRQVCLCGAHAIKAMTKALDTGLKISEAGKRTV